MTIVLDVSFNDPSNSDSQNSAIHEISRKKVKEKQNASSSKAIKPAKVKNKVRKKRPRNLFSLRYQHVQLSAIESW